MFLDLAEVLHLVVPDCAPPVVLELRVATWQLALASTALIAVPHLLFVGPHQGNRKAHPFRTPHPADAVNVLFFFVRKRDINDVRDTPNVNPPSRYISANEEACLAVLELFQILGASTGLSAVESNACVLVHHPAAAAFFRQEGLHVVTVVLCSAKNDGLVHFERVDGLFHICVLQELDGFGHVLWRAPDGLLFEVAQMDTVSATDCEGTFAPPRVGCWVHVADDVVHRLGDGVLALQVDPNGVMHQPVG
mmetsp:Transcript_34706/g.90885  ORF Transcript_34706/g.90885 Transcript_34706/m.90885 type:complete len:250 (+) Transcript_34706:386-1135(+)